jgi:putative DNA primase/helicase
MTAGEIAAALGGAHRSGPWWRCRCPVHGSRGATLALRDGDRRVIAHCHAGCDRRDVIAELRRRGLVPDRTYAVSRSPVGHADDRTEAARRIALARLWWNTAQHACGSPVVLYLAGRGISAPTRPHRWAGRLRCVARTAQMGRRWSPASTAPRAN